MSHNGNLTWMIAEMIIYMLVAVASQIILMYASLAVGQLFSSHRIIGAFLAYFVFCFINQVISASCMMLFNLEASKEYTLVVEGVKTSIEMPAAYNAVMLTCTGIGLALSAVYFYISQYMLKSKLNLE